MGPDPIALDGELAEALKRIEGHPDRHKIVQALAAAAIAQELSRMTMTKVKMIAGQLSAVNPNTLITDWRVLSRHYAGGKHQKVLDDGAEALGKLELDEAQRVIHEIRCAIEPHVNRAMEEKTIRVGFNIPIIGPIAFARFHLNIRGPRVAVHKFQGRVIRLLIQYSLWLSVVLGTAHWISWTIFDVRYLVVNFEGWAKLAQFLLLISTTVIVWAIFRGQTKRFSEQRRYFSFKMLRLAAWLIVTAGWCYWLVWLTFGIPSGNLGVEAAAKLALPFFVVCGSVGAWLSGHLFKGGETDD